MHIEKKIKIFSDIKIYAICADKRKDTILLAGNNKIYQIKSDLIEGEISTHPISGGLISRMVITSDIPLQFAYSVSNSILINDLSSFKSLMSLTVHNVPITCLESQDRHILMSGAVDGHVFTWDMRTGDKPVNQLRFLGSVCQIKCELTDLHLMAVGNESLVHLYDIRNMKESLITDCCDGDAVTSLDWSVQSGEKLVVASNHRNCKIFDMSSLQHEDIVYQNPVWKLKFDPKDKLLLGISCPLQSFAQAGSQDVNIRLSSNLKTYDSVPCLENNFSDFFFSYLAPNDLCPHLLTWSCSNLLSCYSLDYYYTKYSKSSNTNLPGDDDNGKNGDFTNYLMYQYPWLFSLDRLKKDFEKFEILSMNHPTGEYICKWSNMPAFVIFRLKYTSDKLCDYSLHITLADSWSGGHDMDFLLNELVAKYGNDFYRIVKDVETAFRKCLDVSYLGSRCRAEFYDFGRLLKSHRVDNSWVVVFNFKCAHLGRKFQVLSDPSLQTPDDVGKHEEGIQKPPRHRIDQSILKTLGCLYTHGSRSLKEFCKFNSTVAKVKRPLLANLWLIVGIGGDSGLNMFMNNLFKHTLVYYDQIKDVQSVAMIGLTLGLLKNNAADIKSVEHFERNLCRKEHVMLIAHMNLYADMLLSWGIDDSAVRSAVII